jgi:adenine-specific DNA-methyltransferase
VETGFDLVYIDPPYVNRSGVGVDYRAFYHFLEGMVSYPTWAARIDRSSKHRRLLPEPNPWTSAKLCHEMFQRLFENFRGSTLAVSYRSDGIPSLAQLIDYLKAVKRRVTTFTMTRSPYVLSTSRRTREVLLIGTGSR